MSRYIDGQEPALSTIEHDLGVAELRIDVLEAALAAALERIEAVESTPAVACDI